MLTESEEKFTIKRNCVGFISDFLHTKTKKL
jgi:hypothetical protein